MTPILILGAGRMGGALIQGWRKAEAFAPADLILRDPHPTDLAAAVARDGARLNPPDAALGEARTVLLCVKPQLWRDTAGEVASLLHPEAVIVSVAAGVQAADIAAAFGRQVARVMPTTAVAIGQGTTSIYAADPVARARAHALFGPVGTVVDLEDEALMHAATAVSGSAPAYLYAFIEALEAGGAAAGLPPEAAQRLARSTIAGAAALLAQSGEEPAELRRQVTSPGGTTQAALEVLMGEGGLSPLLGEAVAAAVRRSKELGA
ncbi:MAG: pyrroline-5-carboxylate reductase [Phenylobacterium sp.]|nr:pyrroline-5-carboxylate reductase [Phenylobacterium sp.]